MLSTILRMAAGLLLIVVHLLAGRLLTGWLGLPVPGSVIGMLLLAGTLRMQIVRPPALLPTADLLLRYMALFFVPPGVGLLLYFDLLAREWFPIVTATVVSTAAVLCTVALLQQRLEADG
jgi:holin-like protein